MTKEREVTVNGETLTIRQWAERSGITKGAIYMRVYKGMSLEEAVSTPRECRKYAAGLKIKKWTLVRDTGGLDRGSHIWEVVCECGHQDILPVHRFAPCSLRYLKCPECDIRKITAHGRTMSIKQWSEESGVSVQTIKNRLRGGRSPKEAIASATNYRAILVTFQGRTQNIACWAKEIGITREGLRQRLKRMSAEDALTKDKGWSRMEKITVRGRTQTVREWADEVGLSYQRIRGRLKAGWPDEDAIFWGTPRWKPHFEDFDGRKEN